MAANASVPVPLNEAARVLAEEYPEYAFSARRLRTLVQNGAVPSVTPPRGVLASKRRGRPVSILVRVRDLVRAFRSWEREAF